MNALSTAAFALPFVWLAAACAGPQPKREARPLTEQPASSSEEPKGAIPPTRALLLESLDGVGPVEILGADGLSEEELAHLVVVLEGREPKSVDPIAYLDQLAAGEDFGAVGDGTRDWIRLEHVPELMRRIESERPVHHVVATKCSILPSERTTEGLLAMYFLHCFNAGQFPAGLGSHMDSFWSEPEEWREWWRWVQRVERLRLPPVEQGSPWRSLSACDLIDRARAHPAGAALVPSLPPYGWIAADQVPPLMARIRSDRPIATLIFPGFVPRKMPAPSTEGETAMMLLHLYRETLRNHHARVTTTRGSEFDRDPSAWDAWFREWREAEKRGSSQKKWP